MKTQLPSSFRETAPGQRADDILRRCVHCGFCNATCPTYQLLGDELDGPRGRIYLIKNMLEGDAIDPAAGIHLDRCLNCQACETTCPSGVQYSHLLETGREFLAKHAPKPWSKRILERLLISFMLCRPLFEKSLRLGQWVRPLLWSSLRKKIPPREMLSPAPKALHKRRVILPLGCVQPGLRPAIDLATHKILNHLGIGVEIISGGGCCGALPQHRSDLEKARSLAVANIKSWYPALKSGAECILSNASGCGVAIKDYPNLFADDSTWLDQARYCADHTLDLVELLEKEDLSNLRISHSEKFSLHAPCTLQHGQQLAGRVEALLEKLGFQLNDTSNTGVCCGSAGLYSLFQPRIAGQLRGNKLESLQAHQADTVLTANIGCLMHLQAGTETPVQHWIEALANQGIGDQ